MPFEFAQAVAQGSATKTGPSSSHPWAQGVVRSPGAGADRFTAVDRRVDMLLLAATGCAFVAAVLLAVWPGYSDGRTLAETNGSYSYLLLAALVLVTSLPGRLAVEYKPGFSLAVGAGLVILSFITTIGVFFLPAAALLLIAAWLKPGRDA